MTEPVDFARIGAVLAQARARGFKGFSGDCAAAALAIRDTLLEGRGEIVGVFNRAFHAKGRSLGHVAVRIGETFLDADGYPKPFEDIESWGTLGEEDQDYAEMAAELGVVWTGDAPWDTVTIVFETEADLAIFDLSPRGRLAAILEAAARECAAEAVQTEAAP